MQLALRIHIWIFIGLVTFGWISNLDAQHKTFFPGLAETALKTKRVLLPFKINSLFLLPAEEIEIEVLEKNPAKVFTLLGEEGLNSYSGERFVLHAPKTPGWYRYTLKEGVDAVSTLNILVMHPASALQNGIIRGTKIGEYGSLPPPRGFFEMKKEDEDTYLVPHFKIGQFPSRAPAGYPKYLYLDELLLLKLERVLAAVNARGYSADSLVIMSGFRTPIHNQSLGNVSGSRHMLGQAADVYVDVKPKDGVMDDLNGDGKVTKADGVLLSKIVEEVEDDGLVSMGGISVYDTTSAHGPFVHLDVRGKRARW